MKKILSLLLAVACLTVVTSCKKNKGETTLPKGELSFSAVNTKTGFNPASVMDGDLNVGWIGSKRATESNFQVFDIDFGDVKSFSTIILDDSFAAGFTNRRPDYVGQTVSLKDGNTSSIGEGTVAGALSGAADGQSWISEVIPTEEAPQWLWISFSEPVSVKKLELNNEMNNSVSVSYELYYSETAHNGRYEDQYTDVSTYTLLSKQTDNTDNIIKLEMDEAITISDVLLKIYSQQNEGVDVVASLDEVLVYGETPDDYFEEHQPVKFSFLGSNDGKTFDVIVEEGGNYSPVWTHTLTSKVSYRYIRYIVFAENNNNYPSIGELKFQ